MKRPWLEGDEGGDGVGVEGPYEQADEARHVDMEGAKAAGAAAESCGAHVPSGVGWVVIVRGLPGVGKSTFVKSEIARAGRGVVYSPDLYFYRTGEYIFEKAKIGQAHAWCRVSYVAGLCRGEPLIFLDYPFIEKWQYEDYEWMARLGGYQVAVVEVLLSSGGPETLVERNSHGVPIEVIKGMIKKWAPDPRALQVFVD